MHSRATDRKSASKCQGKWPDQTLDQAFGSPEVLVAVSTSRLSCKRARKTRTLMPVWDSYGESRSKGREGILLHVWPRRGIHPQGTCSDQFAVRLNYRGKTCDRRRHAHPATSESADAQGGLTQLRTGGVR